MPTDTDFATVAERCIRGALSVLGYVVPTTAIDAALLLAEWLRLLETMKAGEDSPAALVWRSSYMSCERAGLSETECAHNADAAMRQFIRRFPPRHEGTAGDVAALRAELEKADRSAADYLRHLGALESQVAVLVKERDAAKRDAENFSRLSSEFETRVSSLDEALCAEREDAARTWSIMTAIRQIMRVGEGCDIEKFAESVRETHTMLCRALDVEPAAMPLKSAAFQVLEVLACRERARQLIAERERDAMRADRDTALQDAQTQRERADAAEKQLGEARTRVTDLVKANSILRGKE